MKKDGRADLEIYVLGPFRVSVFGKNINDSQWARPQAKLLLKLLALEPEHQLHREQIMDAIWPKLDSTSAAANLHKIIHMARRALEPELKSGVDSRFISTRDQHVQLAAPGTFWVDASEFETNSSRALQSGNLSEYEDAISLYSGDLLTHDLYADWCARRREKLRAAYQELLRKAGSLYVELRQFRPAIEQFEKLIQSESSNEEAHCELMRLYALTGRRSEALRQFHRCCDAIRKELDAEPDDTTVQLYQKILSKEFLAPTNIESLPGGNTPFDTIAVLPFHDDTGDPDLTYLSSGIAESLIKNLSRLTRARVLAYSTVARYKGQELNPKTLGRDLMTRVLVTGRLAKIEGALAVTAELVNTAMAPSYGANNTRQDRRTFLSSRKRWRGSWPFN